MFRPGEGVLDLFQKNKEDQFGFQSSVYSCQWTVFSVLANKAGDASSADASSVVSPTKLAHRHSSFVLRPSSPPILAPGSRERKRFLQKSTFCQPAGGWLRRNLRAGVDGLVNRG
jgi:hypothetical protein